MSEELFIETENGMIRNPNCPKEIQEIFDSAYLVFTDWAYLLYKNKVGVKYIKCINMNDLSQVVWFRVNEWKSRGLFGFRCHPKFVLDVDIASFDGEELWMVKFWTERNRDFLYEGFTRRNRKYWLRK